jgi:hypothetical protein
MTRGGKGDPEGGVPDKRGDRRQTWLSAAFPGTEGAVMSGTKGSRGPRIYAELLAVSIAIGLTAGFALALLTQLSLSTARAVESAFRPLEIIILIIIKLPDLIYWLLLLLTGRWDHFIRLLPELLDWLRSLGLL